MRFQVVELTEQDRGGLELTTVTVPRSEPSTMKGAVADILRLQSQSGTEGELLIRVVKGE